MNTGAEGEEVDNDENVIKWKIRENVEWGIKDCRRQDSSIQKDWIVLQAHQLPPEFSIAVIGHQGWDKDIAKEVSYALAVSFEVIGVNVPIYEMIRVENEIEIEQEVRLNEEENK